VTPYLIIDQKRVPVHKRHGTTGKRVGPGMPHHVTQRGKQASKDSFMETMESFLNPGLKPQKTGPKKQVKRPQNSEPR